MALPESAPPSRPPVAASEQDLSDGEFAELDAILAQIPQPLDPLDVVMLDGFLAGLIVQPQLIDAERWLPYVFDAGGHRWGEAEPSAEQVRARELVLRRHSAINRTLAEYGRFDPFVLDPAAPEDSASGSAGAADPVSAALGPWVAGFDSATSLFPGLDDVADASVAVALARLYRFLPEVGGEPPAPIASGARQGPGALLDDAIAEVVDCVAELYDATAALRYKVEPVRREAPKVGRNEACPCGSGRKFKHCHGAG